MTCIGWEDSNGCPHYGGDMHGCDEDEGHPGRHRCACGAGFRRPPRRRKNVAECGTDSGYHRHHRYLREDACDACKAAHAAAEARRARVRA